LVRTYKKKGGHGGARQAAGRPPLWNTARCVWVVMAVRRLEREKLGLPMGRDLLRKRKPTQRERKAREILGIPIDNEHKLIPDEWKVIAQRMKRQQPWRRRTAAPQKRRAANLQSVTVSRATNSLGNHAKNHGGQSENSLPPLAG